jgi:hypothetical protein
MNLGEEIETLPGISDEGCQPLLHVYQPHLGSKAIFKSVVF